MNAILSRRRFLQATAGAAAGIGNGLAGAPGAARSVVIEIDPADGVASSAPARWAAGELERALTARGIAARVSEAAVPGAAGARRVVSAGAASPRGRGALRAAGARVHAGPEALALCQTREGVWACGHDARGLTYALLELADRVRHADDPLGALAVPTPIVERPANTVRSITRLFTSDVEDKAWFNDREMWPAYFELLATQRFNRFNLAFGIGYDFLTAVTDAYFLFAYPFLLAVPGYAVRVPQLPDAERDRNLETLRFIAEQAVAHGLEFQLGLWMHGYQWLKSPNPNYTIEGLTPETHGPYCRDALRALLRAVPAIGGVTFRVHGESGVEEGSYRFWKTVFEGVATCGRRVEIDMHAKGMDQGMIDAALGAGQPLKISPKFWAEHLGLPYHQADIREQERPRGEATGLMKLSAGSRSFLRYGYGDLLRDDRRWGVLHRIWPGTERLLIWGDPQAAAAYARAFSFRGSDGVEIMEPLSFKGRRGSGLPGGRCGYADASLNPRWDWQKYAQTYRVWGRLLYNPQADPDVWQRALGRDFGAAAPDLGAALASSSRILPIVTTAHLPSAANNSYWPEMYLNHSLVDAAHPGPYTDTPTPRVFGAVSPLDPQLFYRIDDFADDLLAGTASGKYTPVEVAQWLEDHAAAAGASLLRGESRATGKDRPEYRRLAIDVAVAAGLGRFFAAKFRAGVLYRLFARSGDRGALEQAVKAYRAARDAWADIVVRTTGVYASDITVGEQRQLRGHWADRLPDIDADIAAIAAKLESARPASADAAVARAVAHVLGKPQRLAVSSRHTPAAAFRPGQPLPIAFPAERDYASVILHFRHVTHAERWQDLPMRATGRTWRAAIPAEQAQGPYALQYYFEVRESSGAAGLYPGLGERLTQQPYFVVSSIPTPAAASRTI